MGDDGAVDTVGCHMANVDRRSVIHLKLAAERGIGPIDLKNIEIIGNYPLEEVQSKTKNFISLYKPMTKCSRIIQKSNMCNRRVS